MNEHAPDWPDWMPPVVFVRRGALSAEAIDALSRIGSRPAHVMLVEDTLERVHLGWGKYLGAHGYDYVAGLVSEDP